MFNTLALIAVLVIIIMLKTIVSIIPSVMASFVWWKENINIESSVKLSRARDLTALTMIIPFYLTIFRYRIYNPAFMNGMPDNTRLWTLMGVFGIYGLLRYSARVLARPHRIPMKTYKAANKAAYTFFILLTLLLLAFGGIASFAGMSPEMIKAVMLWLSSLIYGLYLLRKLQIFMSSCSLFAAFLYLCALEFLPTGILVVSGMIF